MPQQVTGGVEATCLLNPRLKAGGRVIINMEDIIALRADTSWQAAAHPNYGAGETDQNNPGVSSGAQYAGLSPTGNYRIHSGDTRGNNWTTQVTCMAIDT